MPSRKLTLGGNVPPSCRYLWTASRPVNTIPDINTSSPTFSARIFSSENGKVSLFIISTKISFAFFGAFPQKPKGRQRLRGEVRRHKSQHELRPKSLCRRR